MESKRIKYNGRTEWRNEKGLLHRLDGPAIEYADGDKSWYQNNKLHRINGPAIEYNNGYKECYINGEPYFPLFLEFEKIINKIKKLSKK